MADLPKGLYSIALELDAAEINGKTVDIDESNTLILRIKNGETTTRNDRTDWTVTSNAYAIGYEDALILDGVQTSFWQPGWRATDFGSLALPYNIDIDMQEEQDVEGFELWRGLNGSATADLPGCDISVSTDGTTWTKVAYIECGDVTNRSEGPFYAYCEKISARYVRIDITTSNRKQASNISEFYTLSE
jgi:hypothetical protein